MSPNLRNGEAIHVEPVTSKPVRRGDIVLTQNPSGMRAHRVVSVDRDLIVTRGDAAQECDQPIRAEQILGRVVALERRSDTGVRKISLISPQTVRIQLIKAFTYRATGHLRASVRRLCRLAGSKAGACAISLLLATLVSAPAFAVVAVDATTSLGQEVNTLAPSLTFNHTSTGANLLLVVGVSMNLQPNPALTVGSVTYNGVAMTRLGFRNDAGTTRRIEMWSLVGPAAGAHNVIVTMANLTGALAGVTAGAITFTGVDQNVPMGAFTSNSGTSNNPLVTVTSATDEIVLDTMAAGGARTVTSFTGSQTQRWNLNSTAAVDTVDVRGFGSTAGGAPTVTPSEALSASSNWAIGAVSIKPVTADLNVTKSIAPNPPSSGQSATYTVTVQNNGPSSATGVTMTDPLPSSVTFTSSTPSQGSCVGTTTVTCSLGTLANGASATVTIVVTVTSMGGLNNTASVTENEFDPTLSNNSATISTNVQSSSCATPTGAGAGGTLTGTINTYYPGTATANAGSTQITLGVPSGSATPISTGDLLLVIQMQDAAIDSTNTDSYGDGVTGPPASGSTSLNSAGNYEYVKATSTLAAGVGGTVTIAGDGAGGGLLYTYTSAAFSATQGQRTFQVIRVPQYSTATLSSTLTALKWNGSVGGVLALDVAQQLTLGGTVDLSGFGFRGGLGRVLTGGAGTNTDYRTLATINTDASKGEGIAGTPHFVTTQGNTGVEGYPNGSYSRGAPGNAGGGGTDADPVANDQNAGGGGGGNGGTGGMGGDGWKATLPTGGFGGAAFPASVSRISLGGGGGAGTTNNGTSDPNTNTTGINSSGGVGGGIIIIRAGAVIGAGTLQANGTDALNVMNDAGGGGGAGGTIVVLTVSGVLTGLTANAHGGKGGSAWLTQAPGTPYPGNRHGPGGGGGGGVVLVSTLPLAASNITGGANGATTTANDSYGSSPGSALAGPISVGNSSAPGAGSGAQCSTDLAITKTSSPNPVITGNILTYTITATNNGLSTAPAVTVTDPLPANVTYVSATPSQGSCSQSAGTVTCNLGSILAGASASITVKVTAGAPSNVSNSATVSNSQTDLSPGDETATDNNVIVFSTAVGLRSLTATRNGSNVFIRWTTAVEARNLGFNVYREISGQRIKVNSSLIAGSALMIRDVMPQHSGRTYSWIDTAPGDAVNYWLEDVSVNGDRTWHGPMYAESVSSSPRLSASSPTLPELADRAASARPSVLTYQKEAVADFKRPTRGRSELQFRLASEPAIKISVQHEGWYRISQAELVAAGMERDANPHSFHLYAEGMEQPIRIDDATDGGGIEFYGTGIDTPYSDTRMYWLKAGDGAGLRIPRATTNANSNDIPQDFPYTVELKDRTTYFAALLNGDADSFFGAIVTSTPTDQQLTVTNLNSASVRDATVKIALQGVTKDVEHRTSVSINGVPLGEVDLSGQSVGSTSFTISPSLVREGTNTVTLTAEGGETDVVLVDYIQLTYPHTYTAENDLLKFTATAGSTVAVHGFSSGRIRTFDVTSSTQILEVPTEVTIESGIIVAKVGIPGSGEDNRTLLMLSDVALDHPAALTKNQPSRWHDSRHQANFVMIGNADFLGAALPLRSIHVSEGMKVAMVNIDNIYDEFNFGEKSPFAIRDFLKSAHDQWQVGPTSVLFVGRASIDPLNHLGFGDLDFVPTKLVNTTELKTASDDWFTDFDQTGFAKIPSGRLPVSTVVETNTVVGKIANYEAIKSTESWMKQALLVADNNDGFDFSAATEAVQASLSPSFSVSTILANDLGLDAARAQLLAALNNGQLFVNYAGHGSVEVWSGGHLLTSEDAAGLANGTKLPVVLIMDCLNGYFQDVYTHSLATSLLLAENGGAVAVWASSGLTDAPPQAQMDETAAQLMVDGPNMALGEIVNSAKLGISDPDVRRTWILFGDPAMHLANSLSRRQAIEANRPLQQPQDRIRLRRNRRSAAR